MTIHNLNDVLSLTKKLYLYLEGRIEFDEYGFPIFKPEMFLKVWPDLVIPYSQRKNRRVKNKKQTLLCFYDSDKNLYPRLANVIDEIGEYKEYLGVCGLDITITDDMDIEWQEYIFLLNQLFLAVLAVNGIKIVVNTRSAGLDESNAFRNIPQNATAASGFLGCDASKEERDFSYIIKILTLLPEKLIIYGKHDKYVESHLDTMGIDFRVYKDFHRLCKEV